VAGHPEMIVDVLRLVGIELDLRIIHDGRRMEDTRHDGFQILHGLPNRPEDLGRHG